MSNVSELKKRGNTDTADLPEGFKMTELGPLPEDWEVVRLHHIFVPVNKKERLIRVQADQIYRTLTVKLYGKGIILREEIEGGKIGTPTLYRTKAYDFVFSKIDARNGAWGFVPEELDGGLVSGDFPILQLIDTIADRDFINFSLSRPNIWEQLRNIAVGTTNRRRIQVPQLLQFPIPLPPLPEQRTIAYVLRTVQRAKDTTERVIQATRELKKSLMHYLFTYGPVPLDEAEKVPLKETEIGLIPEYWEVVRVGDIFEIQQGKALSPKYRTGKSPCPFLRTANVFWGRIDLSIVDEMDFTDEEIQRLRLLPGDLLVCEGGDIGRTAIWRGEMKLCCYQNHLHRLRAKCSESEPEFYMYWMQAALLLFGLYLGQENKTTIPNLSKARLSRFEVPLPPFLEQQAIAHILGVIDKKLQAEEARKQALDILFKTLLYNLMTGKIRVKGLLNPCDSEHHIGEIDREAH